MSAVLAEIRRVCNPGAALHLHVPCEGSPLTLYRLLLAAGIDLTRAAVGHVHHFTRRQALDHLARAGFAVTRRWYSGYLFGQLHDIIGWWAMLSRGPGSSLPSADGGSTGAGSDPGPRAALPQRFRLKHLISRPAWWLIRTLLPRLQYLELTLLAWQPVGAVGLCVTARRRL